MNCRKKNVWKKKLVNKWICLFTGQEFYLTIMKNGWKKKNWDERHSASWHL